MILTDAPRQSQSESLRYRCLIGPSRSGLARIFTYDNVSAQNLSQLSQKVSIRERPKDIPSVDSK